MKKMKRLIRSTAAAGMALVLAVSGVGCGDEKQPEQTQKSVYLLTEASYYDSNGVNYRVETFEYDANGRRVKQTRDDGDIEQVWNEELDIYERVALDVDGDLELTRTWQYDDRGYLAVYAEQNLVNQVDNLYQWEYEGDRVVGIRIGYEGADMEQLPIREIRYNDSGAMTEILYIQQEYDATYTKLNNTAEYDDEGRIISEMMNSMERAEYYDYEYDDEGRLTKVLYSTSAPVPFSTVDREDPWLAPAINLRSTTEYRYDEEGRLLEKNFADEAGEKVYRITYRYEEKGKLIGKDRYEQDVLVQTWSFVYEGETLKGASRNNGEAEYCYDEHGNLIQINEADGTVVKYQYQEMKLSEEDRMRAYRQLQMTKDVGADGENNNISWFENLVLTPVCPELLLDAQTD